MKAETSRGTRAGDRARAAKADHQPEASLAWPYDRATGKESCEA
jgi:hypothetical protein